MSSIPRSLEVPSSEPRLTLMTDRSTQLMRDGYQQPPSRPETDLITACARTNIDKNTENKIAALVESNIDWDYTIEQARQHGLLPLLYWNIRSYAIPPAVKNSLRETFSQNAEFNLLRTKELLLLLDLFESHGIPALSFKGPLLAQRAYRNVALRQFSDLDILVQKRHLRKARKLLLLQGYKLGVELSWLQLRFPLLSQRKDNILVDENRRIVIELHGQLSGSHFQFPLALKDLLPRLQTIYLGGKAVRSLPPEDLLSYLCLHGSRHCWERLLWVTDVAELVQSNPELRWDLVLKQAEKLGGRRTLSLGLLMARDLLGLRIPDDVWQSLQIEPATELLAIDLQDSLFEPVATEKGISYWHQIHMRMRERGSDRFRLRLHYYRRYLRLALVPNERDHALVELPRGLSFLYYALRWLRLLNQYAGSSFRISKRNADSR